MNNINDFKKARIPIYSLLQYSHFKKENNIMIDKNILNKLNFNIIVARYNEDINWLNMFYDIINIYDKGMKYNLHSFQLPNIGREGHTYLYHIINNWDNLSRRTLFQFCQC